MSDPETLMAELESVFTRIQHERMADVPILNEALEVKAVGFIAWQKYYLGVLVTPWFMNLMLMPGNEDWLDEDETGDTVVDTPEDPAAVVAVPKEDDKWLEQQIGTKINHAFPSGNYEFIVGEEDAIGHYQMCSLFSPVFEFKDQETAVATAEAVMSGLMDEVNRDEVSTKQKEIEKIWNGEDSEDELSEKKNDDERGEHLTLKERIEKPMSRRELLSGSFLSDDR